MNEQALDNELAKPEYTGLTDQQAASAVNAKTVSVRVPVDTGDLKFAMIGAGIWSGWNRQHPLAAATHQRAKHAH